MSDKSLGDPSKVLMNKTNLDDFIANLKTQYINEPNNNINTNQSINPIPNIQFDVNEKSGINYYRMNANQLPNDIHQNNSANINNYGIKSQQHQLPLSRNNLNPTIPPMVPTNSNPVTTTSGDNVLRSRGGPPDMYQPTTPNDIRSPQKGITIPIRNRQQQQQHFQMIQQQLDNRTSITTKPNCGGGGGGGGGGVGDPRNNPTDHFIKKMPCNDKKLLEITQNSVHKLRNFFSQLITLTLQKHSPAVSEKVKQSIANVINGSFTVEEFILSVAKLTNCAPAQQEMINFIKMALPYFRGCTDFPGGSTTSILPLTINNDNNDQKLPSVNIIKQTNSTTGYNNDQGIITNHHQPHIIGSSDNNMSGANFQHKKPSQTNKIIKFPDQKLIDSPNLRANLPPTSVNNHNLKNVYNLQSNDHFQKSLNQSKINNNTDFIQNQRNSDVLFGSSGASATVLLKPQQQQLHQQSLHLKPNGMIVENSNLISNSSLNNPNNAIRKSLDTYDPTIIDLKKRSIDLGQNFENINQKKLKKPKIEKNLIPNSQSTFTHNDTTILLEQEVVPHNVIYLNEEALTKFGHNIDQSFFDIKIVSQNILPIVRAYRSLNINTDNFSVFCSLVSHAVEHRLRYMLVNLAKQVHQRVYTSTIMTPCNNLKKMDSTVLSQFKFLDEISILGAKKNKFIEEEKMISLSKSKSKFESPQQQQLKEKAKQYVRDQEKLLATHAANMAAMHAIGDRRRKINNNNNDLSTGLKIPNTITNSSGISNNTNQNHHSNLLSSGNSLDLNSLARLKRSKPRRVTQNRITLNDVQIYLDQDPFAKDQDYLYESINFD